MPRPDSDRVPRVAALATAAALLLLALVLATVARAYAPALFVPHAHPRAVEIGLGAPRTLVSVAAFSAMAVAHLAAVFASLRLAPATRWFVAGATCSIVALGLGFLLADAAPVAAAGVLMLGWLVAVTVGQTVGYASALVFRRFARIEDER